MWVCNIIIMVVNKLFTTDICYAICIIYAMNIFYISPRFSELYFVRYIASFHEWFDIEMNSRRLPLIIYDFFSGSLIWQSLLEKKNMFKIGSMIFGGLWKGYTTKELWGTTVIWHLLCSTYDILHTTCNTIPNTPIHWIGQGKDISLYNT